jgi:hypothetical protein
MDDRERVHHQKTILQMTEATRRVLTDSPPLALGRSRGIYLSVVGPFLIALVTVDLLLGKPVEALAFGTVVSAALSFVVGSWLLVRRRRERHLLAGLWTSYGIALLKGSDESLLGIESLRILAEAQYSHPPNAQELAEIERQLMAANPRRAAAIEAYLRLRVAAQDRKVLTIVSRTMRNRR